MMRMRLFFRLVLLLGFAGAQGVRADEQFPVLRVGSETYSNVVVTAVTATEIYFTHSRGMGTAKLQMLDYGLQKHFHFDPVKAQATEKSQVLANALLREELSKRNATAQRAVREADQRSELADQEDIVVPKLYAKSFRGQRPPQIIVDQWLVPPTDPTGKFVLVDFWATWCGPCKRSIPHLNQLYEKFKDRVVVVGLSNEPLEDLRKMTSPRIEYAVGTDTQSRTMREVGVEGIPHAMLMDPTGIVRFEGSPIYLTEDGLAHLLAKYSP